MTRIYYLLDVKKLLKFYVIDTLFDLFFISLDIL